MFSAAIHLFGREILAIQFGSDTATEQPADDEETPAMGGGSGHNFERDMYPPNPSGEEPWQDHFGFGAHT